MPAKCASRIVHTATHRVHCNTLHRAAPHCYTHTRKTSLAHLLHAPQLNILQHTATHSPHYNTLHHPATHCYTRNRKFSLAHLLHCTTLHHTATHCNTLQHTATHVPVKLASRILSVSQSTFLFVLQKITACSCVSVWLSVCVCVYVCVCACVCVCIHTCMFVPTSKPSASCCRRDQPAHVLLYSWEYVQVYAVVCVCVCVCVRV